jgi:hypothetical protein
MSGATAPAPPAPAPVPDTTDPESIPTPPQDPEKGRVAPVTVPGKSEHPKQ